VSRSAAAWREIEEEQGMLSWLLLLVGLAMVVAGLFVGVISWEVTLALIVVGAVVALAGAFMLVRRGRGAV
jgi:uncharacterized membrane protein